jgi:hypothetical protein
VTDLSFDPIWTDLLEDSRHRAEDGLDAARASATK